VRRLLLMVICGASATLAGAGCGRTAAQTPPVLAIGPANFFPTATREPPPSPSKIAVPAGWRDLKLGMSEQEVQRVVLRYQAKPGRWEKAPQATLLTVRLSNDAIDAVGVDPRRVHEWSIGDLDEGAAQLRVWHEEGALAAIEVTGKVPAEVFLQKATEAYGGAPQHVRLRFGDEATGAWEVRDASLWTGLDATALVWTSRSRVPTLLLWSNPVMTRWAAAYQATLDAPSLAARSAAEASEKATKF
jgi:hypothetical protein